MKEEIEARILEVNKEILEAKLKELGATFVASFMQKRYVYDFNPIEEGKWIRLRTNGSITTLTIKEIKNDSINGTEELEITVDDFDKTNLILEKLGFKSKAYQENKRIRYIYNNIEIDIDSWPLIPTYVEIEGENITAIENLIELLGYKKENIITFGVSKIYKHYGLDIDSYKELKFDLEGNN